jgi:tRNA 2-selenouridine synthase
MRALAESVQELVDARPEEQPPLLVHCWRGGMRSASFCWLLEQVGLQPMMLQGGYKAFRRAAHQAFGAERKLVVLSGMTGAGKTQKLHELAQSGQQTLDLEGLAHHRGSSFGAIGLPPQPTCEQFQNRVYMRLRELDSEQITWVEDESPSIGKVRVPDELWWMMRRSPAFVLQVDRRDRAENLAAEYGQLSAKLLADATQRLEKRLGRPRVTELLNDLDQGKLVDVAYKLLEYYDKTYQHAAKRRPRMHVFKIDSGHSAPELVRRSRDLSPQLLPAAASSEQS